MNYEGSRSAPLIAIEGLKKSFNDHAVLDGVDLSIAEGETIVILGASGSGKSVFINILVGLMEPDEGRILIEGQDVTAFTNDEEWDRLRLKIGFLFQGSALYDSLTIGENISFVLEHHSDLSEREIHERIIQKLRLVGLENVEDQMPAELSGGMQKRAALARALAFDPRIIIYDEPTTGLDPILAKQISELIHRLQLDLKVTSIVVTHDLICASIVADRVALLHEGKFIFVGAMDEMMKSENEYVQEFLEASSLRR
ncbi:MAG: ATP-binding cassette domain-containing protein [Candidatus Abyssobacteria bacterium SURF_5]|uniref:ATP-binding cassette domain-containing protein n=1 Tax=Abyssobacteria bacterium (strain SURF_5) TaxID=2093360 RepID=A0A3A4N984_ABYX5|nr:MAG: ATP-binding cassette domain-containing protein [Candidatus Abyssubacteria bacterium SURF_5]